MSDSEMKRSGGCQCGAVRFETRGAPKRIGACHCRMCQRAVGGPYGIYAVFAAPQVTWTTGAPALWTSSNIASRGFCRNCGTPLTYQSADGSTIDILSAVFDNPSDLGPAYAIGVESKLPWADGLPALPSKSTTENIGAAADRIVSHQTRTQAPTA